MRQRFASKTAEEHKSVTDNLLVDKLHICTSERLQSLSHNILHFMQLKQGIRNACNTQYQYKTYNSKDDTKIDKETIMGCVL